MEKTYLHNWFAKDREKQWNSFFEGASTNQVCVEIGSYEGQSSNWILDNLVGENGHLFAIDYFNRESIFDNNTQDHKEKITKLKGDGVIQMSSLLKTHEEKIDFIYIDSSKIASDNCFALLIAERLLRFGGIVVIDDFLWGYNENLRHTPRLGISTFEQLTLLCETVSPPDRGQYCFVKTKVNYTLVEHHLRSISE